MRDTDLDRMIADDDEPAITIAEPGAGVELATGRRKTNRRAFLYDGHGPTPRDSITERGHLRAAGRFTRVISPVVWAGANSRGSSGRD